MSRRGEDRDIRVRVAPCLDPGRDRRRVRHEDVRIRQLVVEAERDADRAGACTVDQQLQPPRLDGIEWRIGGKREQPGIFLRSYPLAGAGAEPLVVALDEREGPIALHQAQAIEAPPFRFSEVFCAEKIIGPVGGHENGLRIGRKPAPVLFEIAQAQKIAADHRRRQQAGHELAIDLIGRAERHVELGVRRTRFRQRRRHLARGHAPPRHRALGDEVVPRHQLKALGVERRHRDGRPRHPRMQHQVGRGDDSAPHRPRADGRPGNEIRLQRGSAAAQRASGLAGEERIQQGLAHRIVVDIRFAVKHHLGAGDAPGHIDAGDDIERRRRIAGRRDDIEGGENIGGDLAVLVGGDRGWGTFFRSEPFGTRKNHRHHVGREAFGQLAFFGERRGDDQDCEEAEQDNAQGSVRGKTHSTRFPSGMMAASKLAPSVCASVRMAFLRLAPSKLVPRKSAPCRLAPNRSTPAKIAPRRSAP